MNQGDPQNSIPAIAPITLRRSVRIAAKTLAGTQYISKASNAPKLVQPPARVESKAKRSSRQGNTYKKKARALNSSALEAHNKETAAEPLPLVLSQWRTRSHTPISEIILSTRSGNMSQTDKNLPELLTRRNIFDEVFPPISEKPKNLKAIQDAILAVPSSSADMDLLDEQDIRDYSSFCWIISQAGTLEGIHAFGAGQKWGDVAQPKIHHVPRPDYFEGISSLLLPEWIEKHLGNYARPVAGVAFPNFLAENKGEASMKGAHTQCRLGGAYAARGYYELHSLYGNPDVVLDTTFVGTIEFNGEICVGNVHWVSKPSKTSAELQYHMKRVLCCFTRGLNEEDFMRSRRMARNFRNYFAELRVEHLKKLQNLKPRRHPPNYLGLKISALKQELESRNLTTKGQKQDLIKRLEQHDAEENTQALESMLDSVSQSHMNSQGSNPGGSFESPRPSNFTSSFRSQKHAVETDDSDDTRPVPRTKRAKDGFR